MNILPQILNDLNPSIDERTLSLSDTTNEELAEIINTVWQDWFCQSQIQEINRFYAFRIKKLQQFKVEVKSTTELAEANIILSQDTNTIYIAREHLLQKHSIYQAFEKNLNDELANSIDLRKNSTEIHQSSNLPNRKFGWLANQSSSLQNSDSTCPLCPGSSNSNNGSSGNENSSLGTNSLASIVLEETKISPSTNPNINALLSGYKWGSIYSKLSILLLTSLLFESHEIL